MRADDIVRFAATHIGGVTFAGMSAAFPEHFRGTRHLSIPLCNPNIVLWPWCTEEGVNAVHAAYVADRIGFAWTHPVIYRLDGMREMPLPVAQHADHTEPHWWPVSVRVIM
jgi:hypothetical protein